mgnify:FL=1
MHLDQFGLPQQADGDRNDQLQRCGMIAAARHLGGAFYPDEQLLVDRCSVAIDCSGHLQPVRGIYVR